LPGVGNRFQDREVLGHASIAWLALEMGPQELHLLIELAVRHGFGHGLRELNGQDIIRNQTLGVRSAGLALMGHMRELVSNQGLAHPGVRRVAAAPE
jgi:hypothetical protein